MSTHVLIADSAGARLYERHTPENLKEIDAWTNPFGHSADHDIVSDKQGTNTGGGTHGGPLEPEVSPTRPEQQKFIKRVAGDLGKRCLDFEQLIVAASPQVLGDLRKELDSNVRAKIDRELDKDLSHVPLRDLPAHLDKLLAAE